LNPELKDLLTPKVTIGGEEADVNSDDFVSLSDMPKEDFLKLMKGR
jgi:hypothetical protein